MTRRAEDALSDLLSMADYIHTEGNFEGAEMVRRGANELERLREALREIMDAPPHSDAWSMRQIARRGLTGMP